MAEKLQNTGIGSTPSPLEMKNVTVVRNGKKILDSVSLSIKQGEHIAIIGPNGQASPL